jgi:hypothetical protein
VLPATNERADYLFQSVHRTSFERLHREDGLGWLQAAIWYFKTGKGGAQEKHMTIFGYGINIFHNHREAKRALADVKIKHRLYRVAHLPALLYRSSDAEHTLLFVFFAYRNIEIEAYYEYNGVAPASVSHTLRHIFSRQGSHLAHYARRYSAASREAPTPTSTSTPSPTAASTPTVLPTSTPTLTPTARPTSTATPHPTLTATPTLTPTSVPTVGETATPTATATSTGLTAQATMTSQSYPPGSQATVTVQVSRDGAPVNRARFTGSFAYPGKLSNCSGTTDTSGAGSCATLVPNEPNGTVVTVTVQVIAVTGEHVEVSTSFTVQR